ncbi:serine/threonine-protein kinase [Sorangium sp. So ce1128]
MAPGSGDETWAQTASMAEAQGRLLPEEKMPAASDTPRGDERAMAAPALCAGDVVAERFRLVRELGRGAMGSVWLARHEALGVACAVKFIAERFADVREARLRFEREARAAAQIRSPHVVQIMDHGVWRGAPYIAMEYLEGETLGARIEREGRLPHRVTARFLAQVARGLSKAHALGIVHRDLKPDNLFLVRDDEEPTVKILDFGIAKSPPTVGESMAGTRLGTVLGTPYFMSPEQADGTKPVDHRSDLWSLAVIAYRCVVGKMPFESQALGDLFMKIMQMPVPVPSREAPGVPAAFDVWWARATERDPARRFQSAREQSDALARALGVSAEVGEEAGAERSQAAVIAGSAAGGSEPQAGSPGGQGHDASLATTSTEPGLPGGRSNARRHVGIAAALVVAVACGAALWRRAGEVSPAGTGPAAGLTQPTSPPPSVPDPVPTVTPATPASTTAAPAAPPPSETAPATPTAAASAATSAARPARRPPPTCRHPKLGIPCPCPCN